MGHEERKRITDCEQQRGRKLQKKENRKQTHPNGTLKGCFGAKRRGIPLKGSAVGRKRKERGQRLGDSGGK